MMVIALFALKILEIAFWADVVALGIGGIFIVMVEGEPARQKDHIDRALDRAFVGLWTAHICIVLAPWRFLTLLATRPKSLPTPPQTPQRSPKRSRPCRGPHIDVEA